MNRVGESHKYTGESHQYSSLINQFTKGGNIIKTYCAKYKRIIPMYVQLKKKINIPQQPLPRTIDLKSARCLKQLN